MPVSIIANDVPADIDAFIDSLSADECAAYKALICQQIPDFFDDQNQLCKINCVYTLWTNDRSSAHWRA